jgi:uncharacterized protein DUF6518
MSPAARPTVLALGAGSLIGVATSFGPGHLDGVLAAFVNSAAAWLVAPFLVGARAGRLPRARRRRARLGVPGRGRLALRARPAPRGDGGGLGRHRRADPRCDLPAPADLSWLGLVLPAALAAEALLDRAFALAA